MAAILTERCSEFNGRSCIVRHMPEPERETRRARHRRELVDDVCDEARRLLAEGGAGSVTWRGLARAVDMSPASLYTYFESLDDLFTELILRSYRSLATATEAGV